MVRLLVMVLGICVSYVFIFLGLRCFCTLVILHEYQKQSSLPFNVKRRYRLRKRRGFCYFIDIVDASGKYKETVCVDKHEWMGFPDKGLCFGYRDVYVPAYKLDVEPVRKSNRKEKALLKPYVVVRRGDPVSTMKHVLNEDAVSYFTLGVVAMGVCILTCCLIP